MTKCWVTLEKRELAGILRCSLDELLPIVFFRQSVIARSIAIVLIAHKRLEHNKIKAQKCFNPYSVGNTLGT